MSSLRSFFVVLLALAVLSVPVKAEVSVQHNGDQVTSIIMAIVDHIDPVDVQAWFPVRSDENPTISFLNPDGFARGDGRPDMGWFASGWPVVVWSSATGTSREIVYVEWDGTDWTTPQFLTSSTGIDESDPRVLVTQDGTVHVAWWEEGVNDKVVMRTRTDSAGWTAPVVVTEPTESGRRPSLVEHEGMLFVAYERTSAEEGMAQDIVVAEQHSDGGIAVRHLVTSTTRSDRLDPMLHSAAEFLWVDWKHEETEFGHAVAEGANWSNWTVSLWLDPTWIGVESTRLEIRNEILP